MEYEFVFVVDGVSAEDDDAVGVVFDEFDGLLAAHGGLQLLTVSGEGLDAVDASRLLVGRLRHALPRLKILRLDPELVGISDIAERAGRSRQNVAQWVRGERQAGDGAAFPPPEGTAGRSLVWRWGEVNEWLRQLGAEDEMARPSRREALVIDLYLLEPVEGTDQAPARRAAA